MSTGIPVVVGGAPGVPVTISGVAPGSPITIEVTSTVALVVEDANALAALTVDTQTPAITAAALLKGLAGLQVTGTLSLLTAVSKLVPGATSFSIRNHADNADNLIITDAGNATVRGSLTVASGGLAVTGPSTITDSSGATTLTIVNTASAQFGFMNIGNDRALGVQALQIGVAGSTNVVTAFGLTLADYAFVKAAGANNLGLLVGTQSTTPLILGTNNVERMRIFSTGGVNLGAPTGGDKGAGTLNTAGLIYQNNVPVAIAPTVIGPIFPGADLTMTLATTWYTAVTLASALVNGGVYLLSGSALYQDAGVAGDTVTVGLYDSTNSVEIWSGSMKAAASLNGLAEVTIPLIAYSGFAGTPTIIMRCQSTGAADKILQTSGAGAANKATMIQAVRIA